MINCPNCKNTLPAWAQVCQFCGANVTAVPRPMSTEPQLQTGTVLGGPNKWIWIAYFGIAIWFLIGGAIDVVRLIMLATKADSETARTITYVFCVFPGVRALIGLGLLTRVELVRGIVNFVCGLSLLFGLLGLVFNLFTMLATGIWGLIWMVFQLVDLGTNAGMIFLIGETDGFEPRVD